MGYNTTYSLQVQPPKTKTPEEIISELCRSNDEIGYVLTDNGDTYHSGKWYEHERDLREFSQLHPAHLFVLSGKGEDGEEWIKYFRNGKMQVAEAVVQFEPFDETKLK